MQRSQTTMKSGKPTMLSESIFLFSVLRSSSLLWSLAFSASSSNPCTNLVLLPKFLYVYTYLKTTKKKSASSSIIQFQIFFEIHTNNQKKIVQTSKQIHERNPMVKSHFVHDIKSLLWKPDRISRSDWWNRSGIRSELSRKLPMHRTGQKSRKLP